MNMHPTVHAKTKRPHPPTAVGMPSEVVALNIFIRIVGLKLISWDCLL